MKNRDLESAIRDDMSIGNFGDNLNLSSWQPSSKPLTYQEKKDIIRRVKLGWVSNDFIKSYREFTHQELVKKNNQTQKSGKKLSFDRVINDNNEVWFVTNDSKDLNNNTYVKKWLKLSNTRVNKKFSKLNLEERKHLLIDYTIYMNQINWKLRDSIIDKNIIDEKDFKDKNILYYFLILKNTLVSFNLILDRIILKNSVKDAIKELCIIAQSEIFIRKQVISSVTTTITKFNFSDNNSFNNQLFVSERIEKSLKDISGVEPTIKDPLEGLHIKEEGTFIGGEDLNFVDDYNQPTIVQDGDIEKIFEVRGDEDWDNFELNRQSHLAEDDSEPEKTPEEIAKEMAEEKKILNKIKNKEFSMYLDKEYGKGFSFKVMSVMDKLDTVEAKFMKAQSDLTTYEDSENTDLKTWNRLKEKVSKCARDVYNQKQEVEQLKQGELHGISSEGKDYVAGHYVLSVSNLKDYYNKLRIKPCTKKESEAV